MIDKIKGVFTAREEIDVLKKEIASLSTMVSSLGELYKIETTRMRELHETQSDMLSAFLQATQALNKLKEDYRRELEDFRMLNRQAQSKIMDRFNQEVSTLLTANTKSLELDKSQYEKMRNEIQKHGEVLGTLNVEIGKLLLISQRIRSQDFELTEHHKKLLESDAHKLNMMKRIDELEHMIGRFKQSRGPSGPRQF
jgi:hypothetical protein